jgi:cytidine deaminase
VLLTDLIPDAFGPGDLGVTAALMSPQSHGMMLSSGAGDPVVQAALKAAKASYAPYTFDYAGVALKTIDGGIFTGSVAEDAAFNPSMSPLEAAVEEAGYQGNADARFNGVEPRADSCRS